MSFNECPSCRRYTCTCSRYDLEEHHRRHRFDMNWDTEREMKQRIRRMEDDERFEEMRREEERERVRAERQRQERQEEEAYWEAQREAEMEGEDD